MSGQAPMSRSRSGAIRIGRVAGVPVYVNWSWFVIAVVIAMVFGPRFEEVVPGLGAWGYVAGFGFAVLLYGSVLLHEISHVLVAKAFGLPVRAVMLQLLGGVSEIQREPQTPWREFAVAVVGPLTSLGVAAAAFGLQVPLQSGPVLLHRAVVLLALANLIVGVFNLLPGLPLDGGRMLRAGVWALSRDPHTGTAVAAWAGRVFALLVAMIPWLALTFYDRQPDLLLIVSSLIIGVFIWAGSSQALMASRIRRRLPALRARNLARRGIPVPSDLSVAEAMRQADQQNAGAIVVVDPTDGTPTALVSEAAVLAIPTHRRPWVPISDAARRIEPGLILSADLAGEELVRSMGGTPATEYLLVEADGSVFGVLQTTDVDRAFARN